MAVAFGLSTTVKSNTTGAASPIVSNTISLTGSDTLLVGVFTSSGATNLATATTATFAGSSMTLVGNKSSTDGLSNVSVFAIVNPSTVANSTMSCNFTGTIAANNPTIDLDIFSFRGTDTSSVANAVPAANVITDATNANTNYPTTAVSVTTANGDAACGAANTDTTSLTGTVAGAGTLINSEGANNVNYISAYHLAVGATTTIQFSGSPSGAFPSCGVFFRIQQPVAGDVLQASPGMRWM